MLGGLYLCYEGSEKLWHALSHSAEQKAAEHAALRERLAQPDVSPAEAERRKIRGAIRTDFILSAEIIVIPLGIVAEASLATRIGVLSAIALLMTVGVYGLVAGIVKLDDLGLYLSQRPGSGAGAGGLRALGRALLRFAPWLMRALSVLGTLAMFLVGGGILVHGLHALEVAIDGALAGVGGAAASVATVLAHGLLGVVAGFVVVALVGAFTALRARLQRVAS
jgi:predicted DNA repair protein MutK